MSDNDLTALNPASWLCFFYEGLLEHQSNVEAYLSFYTEFISKVDVSSNDKVILVRRYVQTALSAIDETEKLLVETYPINPTAFLRVIGQVRVSISLISLDRGWDSQREKLVNRHVADTLRIIETTIADRVEFEQFSPKDLLSEAKSLREAIQQTESIEPRLKMYLLDTVDELIETLEELRRNGYTNLRERVFQFRGKLISYCSEESVKKMDPQIYTLIIGLVGLATAAVNYGTKSIGPSEKALPPANYNVNVLEDNRFMPQIQINKGSEDQPNSEPTE